MSHAVEEMFSVKLTPWHKLGKVVQDAPTSEDAIKLAGLDWRIEQRPVTTNLDGVHIESDRFMANIRTDNKTVLGVVGTSYKPLQNVDSFKFFDKFVESGLCSYETAGSLFDGRKIWILAKIKGAPLEIVKNDVIEKYLLLSNTHDGTSAIRIGFSPVRVVCNNTLSMAINNKSSQFLRVFHAKKTNETMKDISESINLANASFEATAERYKALAKRSVNKNDLKKYIQIVFDLKDNVTDRKKMSQETLENRIIQLFESGAGQELKEVSGSYWALYNGVTQYLTHETGKGLDRHLSNLWFGGVKRTMDKAFDLAQEMAGVA